MRRRAYAEPGAVDILDQAFHALRTAPVSTLAAYAIGTVPFVLGLLTFWADMTHSPFAHARCAQGAWVLALLFLWMRCWQAVFCSGIRARLRHEPPERWTFARAMRVLSTQLLCAPAGLVAVWVSGLLLAPFAWTYAWYQNLLAVHDRAALGATSAAREAGRLALDAPRQNHMVLLTLFLFRAVVFIGMLILVAQLPFLAKTLLGIESAFTRSMYWMSNTTFLATVAGLTHLCIDPLTKAVYTIRCHYGASRRTGEDLIAELRHRTVSPSAAAIAALLLALLAPVAAAKTAPAPTPAPAPAAPLGAPELDRALDTVMQRREFVWRMPRDLIPEEVSAEKNVIERFAEGLADFSKRVLRSVGRAFGDFIRWLEKKLHLNRKLHGGDESGGNWLSGLNALTWILLGAVCLALGWMLWQAWRRRVPHTGVADVEALQPVVDVEDENVLASQMPEDEWIALAEKLRREGDWRKALRAYFLAFLAWLARRELIEIRRSKSNREYARELDRRARRRPALVALFGENVIRFERSWYGRDAVTEADLDQAAQNLRTLNAHEQP